MERSTPFLAKCPVFYAHIVRFRRMPFANVRIYRSVPGITAADARARRSAGEVGYGETMHNDDIERIDASETEREDDTRDAVVAADDTGLVTQQVTLVEATIGDSDSGAVEERS